VLVTDGIMAETEDYFRARLPRHVGKQIARRAEHVFTVNDFWRRKFAGNRGRAYLSSFLRHWLASSLAREKPALFRQLPDGCRVGEPLPPRAASWAVAANGSLPPSGVGLPTAATVSM
jgi:hypothetical protein